MCLQQKQHKIIIMIIIIIKQTNPSKHIQCYFQYIGIQLIALTFVHFCTLSVFFSTLDRTEYLNRTRIGTRFGLDQVLGHVAGQVGPFQNFGANQMYLSKHLDRTRSEPGSEQIRPCKQHIRKPLFNQKC